MTTPQPAVAPLRTTQILVGSVMAALVVITAVMAGVLPTSGYPPTWVAWALGALAVVSFLLSNAFGYTVAPIAPGTPAAEAAIAGRTAFQSSMFTRLALSEAVAVVGLVVAFVVEPQTIMTVVIGTVLALALLAWHVWPSERVIRKVEQRLDRDGGRSHLFDTLHGRPAGQGGALLS
jgi:F0F1-type ATP synthase membrane subunit c/vacuolar-type H+-ATPase subunit K